MIILPLRGTCDGDVACEREHVHEAGQRLQRVRRVRRRQRREQRRRVGQPAVGEAIHQINKSRSTLLPLTAVREAIHQIRVNKSRSNLPPLTYLAFTRLAVMLCKLYENVLSSQVKYKYNSLFIDLKYYQLHLL